MVGDKMEKRQVLSELMIALRHFLTKMDEVAEQASTDVNDEVQVDCGDIVVSIEQINSHLESIVARLDKA